MRTILFLLICCGLIFANPVFAKPDWAGQGGKKASDDPYWKKKYADEGKDGEKYRAGDDDDDEYKYRRGEQDDVGELERERKQKKEKSKKLKNKEQKIGIGRLIR